MTAQPDFKTDYSATPNLKKRCSACGKWFPYHADYFYVKKERTREGKLRLDSWCKKCRNVKNKRGRERYENESEQATEKRKARLRALQRSRIRLAREFPERFKKILDEELEKEGWATTDDLRGWANRRKGNGVWTRVKCKAPQRCGWTGRRKIQSGNLHKPCPWCGGRVKRA